jgi:hypothetical protein
MANMWESGVVCHLTCFIHAGGRSWRATSAKVANVLLRSFDGGKNVGVNLKVLSQVVSFIKVANS